MLTYSLPEKNEQCLYDYFYQCIKNDIIQGNLMPDQKLPSKRTFAANHGISVVTVENTYAQLMAEGYIYSKPKTGFFVSNIDSNIISSNMVKADVMMDSDIIAKKASYNISLISNHTTSDKFPFLTWAKIVRNVLSEGNDKLLAAPPSGGIMELRAAIAKHLYDFRGIVCNPEQIIIGAGTEYLYGLIVQLLGRDNIYGLENPCSKKIRNIYRALGAKTESLEMDNEGIKLVKDNLEKANIVQISPSHQFPTGIVTSVSRRYGILSWANGSNDRYIIEDDYDSEFRLRGKPIPAMFSMDNTGKVIYFNTFSKSLSSTIRISYMVLPVNLLKTFYEKLGFYSCTVSNFEQYTLSEFIKGSHFEKHINRMRNQYRELRDELIQKINNSSIKDKVVIKEEDSGLHFLLTIKTNYEDDELKSLANDKGLEIAFISEYLDGKIDTSNKAVDKGCNHNTFPYMHTAIINYSGLSLENIDDIVKKLESAWAEV